MAHAMSDPTFLTTRVKVTERMESSHRTSRLDARGLCRARLKHDQGAVG
jgi:hypothetical protein